MVVVRVYPNNESVLRACRVSRRYAKLMRCLTVSDTIRWSRDIYVEPITGHRQYIDPSRPAAAGPAPEDDAA